MAKPRAVRVTAAVLAASLAVATAACGSGVAPKTWAKSVCVALTPWRTKIAALTGQLIHKSPAFVVIDAHGVVAALVIAGAVAYSKRKPIAMSADDGSDGVSQSEQEKVHA